MVKGKRDRTLFVLAYLAPTLLLYGVFVILPLLQVFQLSVYRWKGVSQNRTFVGFDNFKYLATDDAFLKAGKNSLMYIALCGPALVLLGVGVAHMLNANSKTHRFLRSIYLFPQVISMVVVAILWSFLYNPTHGLIQGAMKAIGLGGWVRPWLGDSQYALPAVAVAFVWYALGFYAMLFSAGLQSIPAELKEAAELDGATGWRRFWSITWPLLWSIKRIAMTYIVINVLNMFALVYLMTAGGPDRATETLLTYLYERGFSDFRFGDAAAIGVANLAVALILSGILAFVFRRNPTEVRR